MRAVIELNFENKQVKKWLETKTGSTAEFADAARAMLDACLIEILPKPNPEEPRIEAVEVKPKTKVKKTKKKK